MSLTNNIIALHTGIAQQQLHSDINVAVAAKALDAQKAFGETAVQLLEASVQLSKQAGSGESFDGQA